jgi:threonine/homoserine/homoserine lactone efflux protein
MLRGLGLVAGAAVVGVLALKLLALLLMPLLGMVFGAVMFVLKLALIMGLVYLAWKLFERWGRERGSEAS